MKKRRLAVIGGGPRGLYLARLAMDYPERAKIWAVAEPDEARRKLFQEKLNIPDEQAFCDFKGLLAKCSEIDGVFIATPVKLHCEMTCTCLEKNLPVFLEKPMTMNIEEAVQIVRVAHRTGTQLQIGFNMRYSPFFAKLKQIVASGELGTILSLEWKEVLAPSHFAGGYCRDISYSRRENCGAFILEKCCHDMDIINWLMDSPCVRVSSFGSRSYFNPRPNVPKMCSPDCPTEKSCIFSLRKFGRLPRGNADVSGSEHQQEVCIFHSGSNLVDHQSAILEYDNGATAVFSLMPLSHQEARLMRICGTDATLEGNSATNSLRVYHYDTEENIEYQPKGVVGGHGGGDPRIIESFLNYLDDPQQKPKTTEMEGFESILVAGGIDLARHQKRVVELVPFRKAIEDPQLLTELLGKGNLPKKNKSQKI